MAEGGWLWAGGWRQVVGAGWREWWLEVVAEVVAGEGWCGWRVWPAGMAGLVGIRYSVSLPNRTETPQYWQYIYR